MRTRLVFLLAASLLTAAHAQQRRTALDEYVQAPDSHYRYELVQKTPVADGLTAILLDMTSQQWRTPAELDHSLWKHWLTLYVPKNVKYSTGMLFITGGASNGNKPKIDPMLATIAAETDSVVAELRNVPNEPVTFTNDPFGPRNEDQIIAYTWRKFLETGDSTWPLRLPMTKAAVRAMDTVTSYLASDGGGKLKVDHFVVAGASKRGWTTWTTAAVDPRVVAIAPLVIDVLNVVPSFQHHYRVYGFWANSVGDYYREHLMDVLQTDKYAKLMAIEDPYSYRDRLTMPKMLIDSAGDQFFLPDSSQFYFDKLPGEKHLDYKPNTDHSLKGSDAPSNLSAFYASILTGGKRPDFQWKFEKDGSIRVDAKEAPTSVKLWQATNPEHRDFRLEAVGPIYHSSDVPAEKTGVYIASVEKPKTGWTAYFLELTFPSGGKHPFKFTTPVRVIPDTEPFTLPSSGGTKLEPEPAKK